VTGIQVTSLYGAHDADRRPSHEQLKDLDAVLIDLQDVGVRFFTYETVTGYFLEAAAREKHEFHHDLQVIVLDRPNPTGGSVHGPVSDPGLESYTDYMPLPIQHGMTLGELARYMNGEGANGSGLNADLTVIAMQHWKRSMYFDQTGLRWKNPSPNLRSLTATTLYPGIALLEFTGLSVGRGTETPFELFGEECCSHTSGGVTVKVPLEAGQFKAQHIADALNARQIPGVTFAATSLRVGEDANQYPSHGQGIEAVQVNIVDRKLLDAPELGIEILSALQKLHPHDFQIDKTMRLIANKKIFDALLAGEDPRSIAEGWQQDLDAFKKRREKYLLYPAQ
jgi:uncharacterized protein YbbC (DUF1343 family)